jgi:hypothetical protein
MHGDFRDVVPSRAGTPEGQIRRHVLERGPQIRTVPGSISISFLQNASELRCVDRGGRR